MSHVDHPKLRDTEELSPFNGNSDKSPCASLLSSSGEYIYLRCYHTFGRADNCHSQLTPRSISRLHALIFWQDNHWHIEDKSTNGVWVNEHKIQMGRPHQLQQNDVIVFSSKEAGVFTLNNVQAPQDLLIPLDSHLQPIPLIPSVHELSKAKTLLLSNNHWTLVYNDTINDKQTIMDGDHITLGKHRYRMQHNFVSSSTSQYLPIAQSLEDLTFQLNVSEDEEDIKLYIMDGVQTSEIKGSRIQSQLYLLLYLARKAAADKQEGYADNHRGWVDLSKLSKDLGIEIENTRIRLHRLRARIRDVVSFSDLDVCQLLQLQHGEVRLNTSNIIIYKGKQHES